MCSAESAVVFLASDEQAPTRYAAVEPVALVTACATTAEPASTKPVAARAAVPFPSPPTPELPQHSPPPSLHRCARRPHYHRRARCRYLRRLHHHRHLPRRLPRHRRHITAVAAAVATAADAADVATTVVTADTLTGTCASSGDAVSPTSSSLLPLS